MEPGMPPEIVATAARSRRRTIVALALIALTLRVGLIAGGVDVRRGPRDLEDRYDKIAHSILEGRGFARGGTPTATSPPLYPLFLAGVYGAFGESKTTLMLVLAILDGCACGLCATVAWRLLGRDVGLLAGLAVAFSPYAVYSVLLAGTDTLSVFLLWVALLLLVAGLERRRTLAFLAAGAVLGAAALCRGAALLLPLFLAPLPLIGPGQARLRRARHASALVLGAVLVVTPWTVRNWLHFHQFIPVQTLGGMHLVQGAPAPVRAGAAPALDGATQPSQIARWHEKFNPANPDRDADYYGLAWERIKARPLAFVRNVASHFVTAWFKTQTADFKGFVVPVNATMLALAAIGLAMRRRELWRIAPLWAPIAYYVGVHAFTFPVLRYLLPVLPAVTALAAVPLAWVLARLRRRPLTAAEPSGTP